MFYRVVCGLLSFLFVVSNVAAQQQQWQEGTHYMRLSTPVETRSSDRLEVAEVFWYGCPSCYQMQPVISEWQKNLPDDVNLRRVPASMRADWEPHAKAFYIARELDVVDQVHSRMFDALAGGNRDLGSREAVAGFFEEIGAAEAEQVNNAWDSFTVDTAMRRGRSFQQGARVTGTPTLVVEGRYVIRVRQAGSYENMLAIADYLIAKARSGD